MVPSTMARLARFLATLAAVVALPAAQRHYELRGQIEPARGQAVVTLNGARSPFIAGTRSDSNGRFRFPNLEAAAYTLRVFLPGLGEIEQTVEVGPGSADKRRRVAITVSFSSSSAVKETSDGPYKVSMRELSIPAAAKREYTEAQRLLGKNDVAAAVRRLERAVEIAPQFAEVWNHLGTISYHARKLDDAEKYFRKALEQNPGAFDPAVNLGGVLINLRRPDEALKYNLYAVEEQPRDALANSQTGMNYILLGNHELALKYLKEAKRLDPAHFSHPQLLLAGIYLQRSERKAAIAELEDFLARHPDAPVAEQVRVQLDRLRAQ
jgi:tetratricopeptide (TPR) repeat protein